VCRASRRSTRFGNLPALLAGDFLPRDGAIEQLASDAPVTHPSIVVDFTPTLQDEWAKIARTAFS